MPEEDGGNVHFEAWVRVSTPNYLISIFIKNGRSTWSWKNIYILEIGIEGYLQCHKDTLLKSLASIKSSLVHSSYFLLTCMPTKSMNTCISQNFPTTWNLYMDSWKKFIC